MAIRADGNAVSLLASRRVCGGGPGEHDADIGNPARSAVAGLPGGIVTRRGFANLTVDFRVSREHGPDHDGAPTARCVLRA